MISLILFLISLYAPDHIIVKLQPGLDIEVLNQLNQKYNLIEAKRLFKNCTNNLGMERIYVLEFSEPVDIKMLIKEYQKSEAVEYAEPDYIGYGHFLPNDTYFSNQWGLHNTGQNPSGQQSGTSGCDVEADSAWDQETGSRDIILAILDTGTDLDHPDLVANPSYTTSVFWKNLDEIPNNSIDDDGNGYVDDTLGWNFVSNNNNCQDDHGHGTVNAGIAGARGNNSAGVSGVCHYCKIMTVKVLNSSNWGYYSWWASGLQYAADNGARVINMSMGGTDTSQTLETAINYAWSKGCIITVSMGNSNDSTKNYPAGYDSVIAVGATDNRDQRCNPNIPGCNWGSCYGSWIDVVAPGYWIYSTAWNNTYQYWSGTSMAAPFVAGLAGLILAYNPTLTNYEVRNIIESNTEDLGSSGFDIYYGYGRINLYYALSNTPAIPDWRAVMQLTTPDGYASWEPEIAVNGSSVHIIFSDQRHSNSLYYIRSTDGGVTWGQDTLLSNYQSAYSYYYPSIAVIGDTVLVVFCDKRSDSLAVYFKRSINNGTSWQSDQILSSPTTNSYKCDIAVYQNNVYVIWDSGFRKSTNGGTNWQSINSLVHGSTIAAENGYLHIAYSNYVNDTSQIFYRRYNGTSWESPVQMSFSKGAVWPDIAADNGYVYLVWCQDTDNDAWYEDIFYTRGLSHGSAWSNIIRITGLGPGGQKFTYPRVFARDSVYMLYTGDRDKYNDFEVYLRPSCDHGATWPTTLRITRDTLLSELASMAINGSTLHVVWDNLGTSKEICYRRRGGAVGLEQTQKNILTTDFTCYPNPFTRKIHFIYHKNLKPVTFKIYDITGRLVGQLNNPAIWNGNDTSGKKLPPGVYFIQLRTPVQVLIKKVIKLR